MVLLEGSKIPRQLYLPAQGWQRQVQTSFDPLKIIIAEKLKIKMIREFLEELIP